MTTRTLLRRLLGRTPREILVRAGQQGRIAAERAELAAVRGRRDRADFAPADWVGPRTGKLLQHFRHRPTPRFFPGFADAAAAVSELRSRWPEVVESTIARADRILYGSFDLLGYRGLEFGSPPDWHFDPVHRVHAPRSEHWSRIAYLDPGVAGDHKVVWELNRHQYFVTLGQAYWLSGDERYAEAFVGHLTSWMDQNPARVGMNWASSLEVSFRSISWLWAIHHFRDAPSLTEPFFARLLHYLKLHGQHIERYLSTYFSPNTHLTGEALGLVYLGTVLPEFRQARRWRRMGLRILAEEIPRQVLSDGVYFEQSTWYHRYTVDFLLHLIALERSSGTGVAGEHATVLQQMLDHVLALTRPDGTVPLIGDDDGGCLLPLGGPPTGDFRPLLAVGAALFGRSDYKYVAGRPSVETLWLLGTEGLERFDELPSAEPTVRSAAFPAGGFYVMRDGWTEDANYLLVDAGPHGALSGGHAHADALAVVVSTGPDNVLVDSGTGTYTADPVARDTFRSTPAHNTLSIAGASSAVPAGPFRWEVMVTAIVDRWYSGERFDFFHGRHAGFSRDDRELEHERSILFVKRGYWIMRDRIAAPGPDSVESRFHFDPRLSVVQAGNGAIVVTGGAGRDVMRIHVFGARANPTLEDCLISDVYGSFRPAIRASCTAQDHGTTDLVTLLLPGLHAAGVEARRLPGSDGTLLALAHGRSVDLVAVGAEAGISEAGIVTDSEWAWVRRCAATGRLEDYVLINGSTLHVDGERVVARDARVPYLCMDQGGDR